MTDAENGTRNYLYDALSRLVKEQDAMGNVTGYSYDGVGNRISMTTPNGGVYRYSYDKHGNPTAPATNQYATAVNWPYVQAQVTARLYQDIPEEYLKFRIPVYK